jgi:hypothetical protein
MSNKLNDYLCVSGRVSPAGDLLLDSNLLRTVLRAHKYLDKEVEVYIQPKIDTRSAAKRYYRGVVLKAYQGYLMETANEFKTLDELHLENLMLHYGAKPRLLEVEGVTTIIIDDPANLQDQKMTYEIFLYFLQLVIADYSMKGALIPEAIKK